MTKTADLAREPDEEETELARECALAMNKGLATAPNIGIGIGAIGMLTVQAFVQGVKPEYVIDAFNLWVDDTRKQIEKELRRAHN